jgi:hypothetical protein
MYKLCQSCGQQLSSSEIKDGAEYCDECVLLFSQDEEQF